MGCVDLSQVIVARLMSYVVASVIIERYKKAVTSSSIGAHNRTDGAWV